MISKKLLVFPLLSLALLSVSCGDKAKRFDTYTNRWGFIDGSFEMSFTDVSGYNSSGNYSLSFNINLISRDPHPYNFKPGNRFVCRESNGATYRVSSTMIAPTITLECDIKNSYYCTVTIPTSIKDDKYYFSLEFNDKNVAVFHFYDESIYNIK